MYRICFFIILGLSLSAKAQLRLADIIDTIQKNNPVIKMYDNEIRSMDEAAKGARS